MKARSARGYYFRNILKSSSFALGLAATTFEDERAFIILIPRLQLDERIRALRLCCWSSLVAAGIPSLTLAAL